MTWLFKRSMNQGIEKMAKGLSSGVDGADFR